ncbi:MAG: exopolysaccharide biosynthesis protein [Coraliomargaritaceae bacterium]
MQTQPKIDEHKSLATALEHCLQQPNGKSDSARGPSIGELCEALGEKGFGLLLVILSLPSALPLPAPGYSTPFGIALALLALQMLTGRRSLWLPRKLYQLRIEPKLASKMIQTASRFLRSIERWIQPRQAWIRSRAGQAALAGLVLIMSALMILPIPLTNTLPAMVIFLIGVGLSEEDGLLALLAFAVGLLAVVLYTAIVTLLITQGPEAIDALKDWIKAAIR